LTLMASVISSLVPSPIYNIGSFSLTSSSTIVAEAEVSSIDETTTGPILRQKKISRSSLFIVLLDIPLLVPTATLVVHRLFSLFSASSSPSNSLLPPKPVSGSSQLLQDSKCSNAVRRIPVSKVYRCNQSLWFQGGMHRSEPRSILRHKSWDRYPWGL